LIQKGYLFKGSWLWTLNCGTYELLIKEICGGLFARNFRENKTLIMLREHYFCPSMSKDVEDTLRR